MPSPHHSGKLPSPLPSPTAHRNSFNELLGRLSQTVTQLAKVYQDDLAAALQQSDSLQSASAEQEVEKSLHAAQICDIEQVASALQTSNDFSGEIDGRKAHTSMRPMRNHVVHKVSFQSFQQNGNSSTAENMGNHSQGPRTSDRVSSISLAESAAESEDEFRASTTVENASTQSSHQANTVDDKEGEAPAELVLVGARFTEDSSDLSSEPFGQKTLDGDAPKTFFSLRSPWIDATEFEGLKLVDVITAERYTRARKGVYESVDSALKFQDRSGSGKLEEDAQLEAESCRFIMHPESRLRGFWVLTSVGFLIYDMVMMPIDVCFDLSPTTFTNALDLTTVVFWTLDMILTFFTGVRTEEYVERRPCRIAAIYLKSWFIFDVVLVLTEWSSLIISDGDMADADVSIFRILRWGRLMRLLRMARILRLRLLMRRVVLVFNLSKVYAHLTQGLVGLSVLLVVFIHMLSCFWYAIGSMSDDGWVSTNDLQSASVGDVYIVSVRWSFSRLHGLMSNYTLQSKWEALLDAILIYLSLMLAAYYQGLVVAFSMTRAQSKQTGNLWKLSLEYVKRHNVSSALGMRLFKYVESVCFTGVNETAEEEMILLQALPSILKEDLLFEARARSLLTKPFFADMFWDINPRVVRLICSQAMSLCVFVEGEVIFAHGDACHRMLFLVSGHLNYVDDSMPDDSMPEAYETSLKVSVQRRVSITGNKVFKLASLRTYKTEATTKQLSRGSSVSEPVLWTEWAHVGRLVSSDEATSLTLCPLEFANVIVGYKGAKGPYMHAARYAKHFVWHLNHSEDIDDLSYFDKLTIDELDADLFEGTDTDHFMFISHYKVEAGTEATLMGELFADILRQDPSHPANDLRSPIFIDSEDLTDLALLRMHVENTTALVLLLTPGMLSRPWCLVEIVTAVKNAVDIVPVEIQRPGSSYRYPNEEFYADLLAGNFLNQGSLDLLESEGIELVDVERAIRQVFQKIALPFSPHKTKAIREAELTDILKRCSGDSWMRARSTLRIPQTGNYSSRRLSARLA